MAELNLHQKLAAIREMVEVMQRNVSGYGYKYVSDVDLLAKITVGLKEHHVSLIPQIVPGTTVVDKYEYTKTKNGKTEPVYEILTKADMLFTWVNDDNPEEKIEVPWVLVGQQGDGSQAFGSGLTYSYRYFLLKYFGVATPNDDPDNWRSKQLEAEEEAAQRAKAEANKELAAKRKEITELGTNAISKKLVTGPEMRALIEKLNPAGGSPGDIESIEIADKVIEAIKALKPVGKKTKARKAESKEDETSETKEE